MWEYWRDYKHFPTFAGAIGHGVAALLGADPTHLMNDDLMRMKTMETGQPPRGAAAKSPPP